jgi:uncharacterized membrane protein
LISMNRVRLFYWLAASVALGGVLGALLIPFGQVRSCVESVRPGFSGCREDNVVARIVVALIGFMMSGLLVSVAVASKNRWRRDARYWKSTD